MVDRKLYVIVIVIGITTPVERQGMAVRPGTQDRPQGLTPGRTEERAHTAAQRPSMVLVTDTATVEQEGLARGMSHPPGPGWRPLPRTALRVVFTRR